MPGPCQALWPWKPPLGWDLLAWTASPEESVEARHGALASPVAW